VKEKEGKNAKKDKPKEWEKQENKGPEILSVKGGKSFPRNREKGSA